MRLYCFESKYYREWIRAFADRTLIAAAGNQLVAVSCIDRSEITVSWTLPQVIKVFDHCGARV